MRFLVVALVALGPLGCERTCPGSSGLLTGSFNNQTFQLTCFQAFEINSGGQSLQFTGTAGDTGTPQAELVVAFVERTGCSFQTGQVVSLTDPCSVLQISVPGTESLASNLGISAPLGTAGAPSPLTRGSYTVTSWPTSAGGTLSVSFSSDAQVAFDSETPGGPVGISGSAGGTLVL